MGCRAGWDAWWDAGCRLGCRVQGRMQEAEQGAGWDAGCSEHAPAAGTGQSGAARSARSLSGPETPTPRPAQPQHQQPGSHQHKLFQAGVDVCLRALSSQNEAYKGRRVHRRVVHPKTDMTLHQPAHKLCAYSLLITAELHFPATCESA